MIFRFDNVWIKDLLLGSNIWKRFTSGLSTRCVPGRDLRLLTLIKLRNKSVDQTCKSQLLLNQRGQHCGSALSQRAFTSSKSASGDWTGEQWPLKKENQTVTYMSKFLHAVLHGSGNHSLFPSGVRVRWCSSGAETGKMKWHRPGRGCASGGGERWRSPPPPPLQTLGWWDHFTEPGDAH